MTVKEWKEWLEEFDTAVIDADLGVLHQMLLYVINSSNKDLIKLANILAKKRT